MTSGDVATVATAIGVVLAQVAAIIIALRGNARSKENGQKIDDNRAVLDDQAKKIEEIHAQTGVFTTLKIPPP